MTIARWKPPVAPTRQEQVLLKRLDRVRKLLGFLRLHRHECSTRRFRMSWPPCTARRVPARTSR